MALLKYVGTSELIQVYGYGHFKPGDEKEVDDMTAAIFSDQRCVDEGFEVTLSPAAKDGERKLEGSDETLSPLGRKEYNHQQEQERNQ
jgi:hypothetical protein